MIVGNVSRGLGRFVYLVKPTEYIYSHHTDHVNDVYGETWPFFVSLILLENTLRYLQKKPLTRFSEGLNNVSHILLYECIRILSKGSENYLYIFIYRNYRMVSLSCNSVILWYMTALLVDFCYYWAHRANHEINILWMQHQVHHSSEDFNLMVGLRQSVLHSWCSSIFYLPLAWYVPPTYLLVHQQLNMIYQFWIHTETIGTLGPLEYIFNTPNHHRIHHGSNKVCLDKNYGGVLIVWDKLFGTFYQSHQCQNNIIYGLVHQPPLLNPVYQQIFYIDGLYRKWTEMSSIKDKLSSLLKGPSWRPGTKWTGNEDGKLDVTSRLTYDTKMPLPLKVYLLLHLVIDISVVTTISADNLGEAAISVAYIICSLATIGMLLDNQENTVIYEIIRSMLAVICDGSLIVILLRRNFYSRTEPKSVRFICYRMICTFLLSLFWCLSGRKFYCKDHDYNE